MRLRYAIITALTALLSVLPVLYLRLVWSTVPTLVAIHFNNSGADGFTHRQALWDMARLPLVAFVALTFSLR